MMPGSWLRCFVALCITAAAALATPPLTDIQDVLYKANGTLFEGVAQIEWKTFVSADGTPVPQNTVNIRVVRGQLRVSLIPTTDAAQATYYTVHFNSEGKTQFIEYWSVPPSVAVMRLRDVRTQGPVGGAGNLTSGLAIQEILGLRTELDLRPSRGNSWTANRAAVIGSSGTIEAVSGSDQDCVRVDGTSGPCGSAMSFVDGEVPEGPINGSNAVFALGATPLPAESLRIFRNGILLGTGEFSTYGKVVTIVAGRVPTFGDVIQAWYRTSGAVPAIVEAEVPAGVSNGVNLTFTLQNAPMPAASLQMYRNGMLQKSGVDYNVTATLVTFLPLSVPGVGDLLQATYRK